MREGNLGERATQWIGGGCFSAVASMGGFWCGLTFELRRDRRQDARPGPVKMYAYHRPGPGGLPLGLASNEGLGLTLAAPRGLEFLGAPRWLPVSADGVAGAVLRRRGTRMAPAARLRGAGQTSAPANNGVNEGLLALAV